MELSLTSFISSSVAITLLIGILFLIIKKEKILSNFGLGCIYFLVILILLRGFLPFDFYAIELTTSIYSYEILPKLNDMMKSSLATIGTVSITPYKLLFTIWILGACIYLSRLINSYRQSKKFIFSLPQITEANVLNTYQRALDKVYPKKKANFNLVSADTFSSPAIWGTKTPYIILPPVEYTTDELYYVFVHELLHFKRKDFLCKLLMDLLICVHWWNPLVSKFLFPVVNQIQELSVDYQVTKTLDNEQKAQYMEALTKTLRYSSQSTTKYTKSFNNRSYTLVDSHTKVSILQRLQYIMKHQIKQLSLWGVFLCILLFIGSFTIVFEPSHHISEDEKGEQVYKNIDGQTFYVKNGDAYDLYMNNEYVYTTPEILESLNNVPIYNSLEEVN